MAKKFESKRKPLSSSTGPKTNKSKFDARERQIEKSKLQDELLALQRNEDSKALEHQVKYYVYLHIVYNFMLHKNEVLNSMKLLN